jgi:conflict system pore-forming effector with SLATT domain
LGSDQKKLLGIARELYGRLVYSHKTHEKQRELCAKTVSITKWVAIILTGLTFLSACISFGVSPKFEDFLKWVIALLGAGSFIHTIYHLSFTPEKLVQEHRFTAKKLLSVRDRMLFLIQELMNESCDMEQIKRRLESINTEITLIYEYAPDTSSKAYKKAWPESKATEEMTFSEEEIDLLLPTNLRIIDHERSL